MKAQWWSKFGVWFRVNLSGKIATNEDILNDGKSKGNFWGELHAWEEKYYY
jgi:hypothetical protein